MATGGERNTGLARTEAQTSLFQLLSPDPQLSIFLHHGNTPKNSVGNLMSLLKHGRGRQNTGTRLNAPRARQLLLILNLRCTEEGPPPHPSSHRAAAPPEDKERGGGQIRETLEQATKRKERDGLRINFHKSELMVLGANAPEQIGRAHV